MNIEQELLELKKIVLTQRDEIEVQLHLATMDIKEEWDNTEKKREEFIESLGVISNETKEASSEMIHAVKVIGDELKEAYKRISIELKNK